MRPRTTFRGFCVSARKASARPRIWRSSPYLQLSFNSAQCRGGLEHDSHRQDCRRTVRAEGHQIEDETQSHVTPLMRKHVTRLDGIISTSAECDRISTGHRSPALNGGFRLDVLSTPTVAAMSISSSAPHFGHAISHISLTVLTLMDASVLLRLKRGGDRGRDRNSLCVSQPPDRPRPFPACRALPAIAAGRRYQPPRSLRHDATAGFAVVSQRSQRLLAWRFEDTSMGKVLNREVHSILRRCPTPVVFLRTFVGAGL